MAPTLLAFHEVMRNYIIYITLGSSGRQNMRNRFMEDLNAFAIKILMLTTM